MEVGAFKERHLIVLLIISQMNEKDSFVIYNVYINPTGTVSLTDLASLHLSISCVLCAALFQMYNIFPWVMEHIPGPQHKMFNYIQELKDFIKTKIQEHKETLDPSSPRDYIDCFLIRMEQVGKNFRNTLFV